MDMIHGNISEQENTSQRYEVLRELGDCYASVGSCEQAQRCYEKAASLGPDEADPYVGLGVVAMQQGLLEDAEIAFRVAYRLDSASSKACAGLAMVAQERGDYGQAFDMYLRCLELDTDNLTALLGLFQASCKMGSFAQVIHYLEVYLDMHPGDGSVMFSLAALYVREGRLIEAELLLKDILVVDADNRDASDLLEEVEHSLAGRKQEAE